MTRPNSRGCISSCKVPLVQSLHPFSVKRKTPGSAKVKQVLEDGIAKKLSKVDD